MPRPPVHNWGSSPYHLVDDILRSVESLGMFTHYEVIMDDFKSSNILSHQLN